MARPGCQVDRRGGGGCRAVLAGGVGGRRGRGLTVAYGIALAGAIPLRGSRSGAPRRLRRAPRSPSLPRPGRAASTGAASLVAVLRARSPASGAAVPDLPFVSGRLHHKQSAPPTPAATAAIIRAAGGWGVAVTIAVWRRRSCCSTSSGGGGRVRWSGAPRVQQSRSLAGPWRLVARRLCSASACPATRSRGDNELLSP